MSIFLLHSDLPVVRVKSIAPGFTLEASLLIISFSHPPNGWSRKTERLFCRMAHSEEGQSRSQSQWESKENPTLVIQGITTTITVSCLKTSAQLFFLRSLYFGLLCRQVLQYKMTLYLHWLYMRAHTCVQDHRQACHIQNNATQECTSKHQLYEDIMHYAHFTGRENYLQSPTQRFPQRPILKILVTYLWMGLYTLVTRLPTRNTHWHLKNEVRIFKE